MSGRRGKRRYRRLGPGKLPAEFLADVLAGFRNRRRDVVVGPALGVDAAVVRVDKGCLSVTSDPITLAEDLLAYYCVHVNANDLAVMGARPQFLTAVCLLPVGSGEQVIRRIGADLARYSRPMNVAVIGGHCEVTPTVTAPVIVGTMIGRLETSKPISSSGAKPGDVVVMTKHAALEATAIIARERPNWLIRAGFGETSVRRLQRFLFHPGISILPEAHLARGAECSAMHDATEGGVVTGLWELASASKVRIDVDLSRIPILSSTLRACEPFKIDPLRAISSGALLMTISSRRLAGLMSGLKRHKIAATVIGWVKSGRARVRDTSSNATLGPCPDEIVKLF